MMAILDLLIAMCSFGLVLTTIPTLVNKKSRVPRWSSSVPIAAILTFMVPCYYFAGLTITTVTLCGQALVWWLVAIFRGIK